MMPRHNLAFLGDHIKGSRTEHSFLMPRSTSLTLKEELTALLESHRVTNLKGRNFDSVVLTKRGVVLRTNTCISCLHAIARKQ